MRTCIIIIVQQIYGFVYLFVTINTALQLFARNKADNRRFAPDANAFFA
jgi:hypothetical protein